MRDAREVHCIAAMEGRIYVIGGKTHLAYSYLQWSQNVTNRCMRDAREGHCIAAIKGNIYPLEVRLIGHLATIKL